MARSTRYDHLLPFLGDKDDMRGRLIIDAMKDNYNQNGQDMKDIRLKTENNENQLTLNKMTIIGICDEREIENYSYDVYQRSLDEESKKKGLQTILNLSKNISNFEFLFISKFAKIFNKDNKNISNLPNNWNQATNWEWNKNILLDSLVDANQHRQFDGRTDFDCNIDKFLLQRLYENISKESEKKMEEISDFFKIPDQKLHRDENNVLVDEFNNNVDIGSKHYYNLNKNNDCFTTNMNELQCTNYFRKCLVNQNIDDCKEFLKSDNYWDIMTNEVAKLDPVIALETLKAFEFDLETNSNNVIQPETIESWSSKLENKLGGENSKRDAELIRNNNKIMKYLIAIRGVVVGEPALLNMRKKDRADVSNSPIPAKRFTSKYTYRFVSELKNNIKQQWKNQALNWNMLNMDQKGGDNKSIIDSIEKENLQVPFLWKSLGSLLKNININKNENKADLNAIQENLKKLRDAETKLYKTFWYKKKYVDLINLGYNDGKNSVSMDDIKQFVDKFNDTRNRYLVKVSQRQNKVLTMLEMLAKRIESL